MTTCRLVENGLDAQPGDMWFAPHMVDGDSAAWYSEHFLSNEYKRDWLGKRPPLVVLLTGHLAFCVDRRAVPAEEEGQGWTVTGEPPRITVHPSIQSGDLYHGWLRDGELTPA